MKMCAARLSAFLLALLLLSSQMAEAQIGTGSVKTTQPNSVTPTASTNMMIKDKNGSGRLDAITVLLPLALTVSLLHSWSQ